MAYSPFLEDVEGLIRLFIWEELWEAASTWSDDLPLVSGGYIDPAGMASLKEFLERRFDIVIPPEEATGEAFDGVGRIAALVRRHLQKPHP